MSDFLTVKEVVDGVDRVFDYINLDKYARVSITSNESDKIPVITFYAKDVIHLVFKNEDRMNNAYDLICRGERVIYL